MPVKKHILAISGRIRLPILCGNPECQSTDLRDATMHHGMSGTITPYGQKYKYSRWGSLFYPYPEKSVTPGWDHPSTSTNSFEVRREYKQTLNLLSKELQTEPYSKENAKRNISWDLRCGQCSFRQEVTTRGTNSYRVFTYLKSLYIDSLGSYQSQLHGPIGFFEKFIVALATGCRGSDSDWICNKSVIDVEGPTAYKVLPSSFRDKFEPEAPIQDSNRRREYKDEVNRLVDSELSERELEFLDEWNLGGEIGTKICFLYVKKFGVEHFLLRQSTGFLSRLINEAYPEKSATEFELQALIKRQKAEEQTEIDRQEVACQKKEEEKIDLTELEVKLLEAKHKIALMKASKDAAEAKQLEKFAGADAKSLETARKTAGFTLRPLIKDLEREEAILKNLEELKKKEVARLKKEEEKEEEKFQQLIATSPSINSKDEPRKKHHSESGEFIGLSKIPWTYQKETYNLYSHRDEIIKSHDSRLKPLSGSEPMDYWSATDLELEQEKIPTISTEGVSGSDFDFWQCGNSYLVFGAMPDCDCDGCKEPVYLRGWIDRGDLFLADLNDAADTIWPIAQGMSMCDVLQSFGNPKSVIPRISGDIFVYLAESTLGKEVSGFPDSTTGDWNKKKILAAIQFTKEKYEVIGKSDPPQFLIKSRTARSSIWIDTVNYFPVRENPRYQELKSSEYYDWRSKELIRILNLPKEMKQREMDFELEEQRRAEQEREAAALRRAEEQRRAEQEREAAALRRAEEQRRAVEEREVEELRKDTEARKFFSYDQMVSHTKNMETTKEIGDAFEEWCKNLLVSMGYEVEIMGGSGDQGIDLIAKKGDELIQHTALVQCKHQGNPVSLAILSQLLGMVMTRGADRGIVMTSATFTKDAEQYNKENSNLLCLDGKKLKQLSEEHLN